MFDSTVQSLANSHYYARTPPPGRSDFQHLDDHLRNVGLLCESAVSAALGDEFGPAGRLLGLTHDLGKALPEWQTAIREIAAGESASLPPHAIWGAKWLESQKGVLADDLLSYLVRSVLSHHAGLPDAGELAGRLKRTLGNELTDFLSRFPDPVEQLEKVVAAGTPALLQRTRSLVSMQLLTRVLLSVLVDADRLDSERFSAPELYRSRETVAPWNPEQFLARLESYRADRFGGSNSRIGTFRARVLQLAREAAVLEPGFFSFTVPTGGGKTLSSLEFALRHAQAHPEHGFRRIIVVMPYLSIIEQNAQVMRDALTFGMKPEEVQCVLTVLEHHSAIREDEDEDGEHRELRSLTAENWSVPIVLTTSVQFLETLFSNRPSRLRKLHNIARSVIIFDEAQTLPKALLLPTLHALRSLVDTLSCSVVLSTATQPALEAREQFPEGLPNMRAIIPPEEAESLYREMKRVTICLRTARQVMPWQELAERLQKEETSVLCVVNTRRHARLLAEMLPDALHFSSSMCAHHRTAVIEEAKRRLAAGRCLMISTQAIEAGVDISFPVVWRAVAPMEAVIQAAGRCNRHMELAEQGKFGSVYLFHPPETDGPITPLEQFYREGTMRLKDLVALKPDTDLEQHSVFQVWSAEDLEVAHERGRLDKLCLMTDIRYERFAQIAEKYRLIEEGSPVVVHYQTPSGETPEPCLEKIRKRGQALQEYYRFLQRFTVSLRHANLQQLRTAGLLDETNFPGLTVLHRDAYHDRFGVILPEALSPYIVSDPRAVDWDFGDRGWDLCKE